jgi:hypothetical protein
VAASVAGRARPAATLGLEERLSGGGDAPAPTQAYASNGCGLAWLVGGLWRGVATPNPTLARLLPQPHSSESELHERYRCGTGAARLGCSRRLAARSMDLLAQHFAWLQV